MAEINTALIKQLRELTGAGVLACKNALVDNNGDLDAAVEALRKKGEATAVKKATRIAAEGIVTAVIKGNQAVILEVNSETDFVAKNEKFQKFAADVVESIFACDAADTEALMNEKWAADPSITVGEALVRIIATIGEKISIRRFQKVTSDNTLVSYIHGGGRIGVIVEAENAASEAGQEAAKNIAMQVAALNPQYISRANISADELAKMREITIDSAINDPASLPKPILLKLLASAVEKNVWSEADLAQYEEQKNNLNYLFNFLSEDARKAVAALGMEAKDEIVTDKIFNGLVEGRVSKQVKEVSLYDQVYVKAEDGKQSVAAYLKSVGGVEIKQYVRFETGEGIEKRKEDFAAEVAAQMGL